MSETPPTSKRIRVIIADDHPIVRTGLRLMLQMRDTFELVGEAENGAMAVSLVQEHQPDVVLMDLRMPETDGLSALKQIRSQYPQIAVLILTTYNEDNLIMQALRAGARGYLLKDADVEILLRSIERAALGEMLIQPEMMERILAYTDRTSSTHSPKQGELTQKELEVLASVANGERSKEIAKHLGISERTVWAYLTTIYNKLGVDSRASAVAVALERGLLPRKN
mgnify:CR=1 FL=1